MNASSQPPNEGRAPELERTADRIRADLDRTLDALERRLAPSQLLDRSLAYLREHGGDLTRSVGEACRRNPVPIVLAIAGIGWLVVASTRRRDPADVDPIDVDDEIIVEEALVDEAIDAESYTPRSRFRDRMSMARAQTRRAQYRVVSAVEERPLVFGGLAVAIGALLGAVIPSTQYEDKVVGQVRDRAVERAKQMGERQYQNLRSKLETQRDVEVSGQAH
jgi:hypothetical protein